MKWRGRATILGDAGTDVVYAAITQSTVTDDTEGTLVIKIETFSGVHTYEAF